MLDRLAADPPRPAQGTWRRERGAPSLAEVNRSVAVATTGSAWPKAAAFRVATPRLRLLFGSTTRLRSRQQGIVMRRLVSLALFTTLVAPACAAPPVFSWSGFYIGADAGLGVPLNDASRLEALGAIPPGFGLYAPGRGGLGPTLGVHVGRLWQTGPWVYGFETELSLLRGRRDPAGVFPASAAYGGLDVSVFSLTAEPSGDYFGAFRGRLGYAFGRTLIYATAGVANGGWRGGSTLAFAPVDLGGPFTTGLSQSSRTKYVVGAGIERALDERWSVRGEYLFLNQQLQTQVFDNGTGIFFVRRLANENHVLRFGLNYRWPDTPFERFPWDQAPAGKPANEDDKGGAKAAETELVAAHGQVSVVPQAYPRFRALYDGPNSLPRRGQARSTTSATGFFGVRLWSGAEAWITPEIDQGFGLANTLGVAGYVNGEAYKVGRAAPYLRFQRAFIRQTFGLGGETETLDAAQQQLARPVDKDRVTLTAGKFAVTDIFDDNRYAHDPRNGFFNWSVFDMGAFDYAADSWGYTYGVAGELRKDWWTARGGVFQLSITPNSERIEPVPFRQYSAVAEFEARYAIAGQPGKLRFLAYANTGFMGKYDDAVRFGLVRGETPDLALDRRRRTKIGGGVNLEQQITPEFGLFARVSAADGRYEASEFTEIERSASGGFVFSGSLWDRPRDQIGIAGVANGISGSHARYLSLGGTGILLGDGALRYGSERLLEAYYKVGLAEGVHVTGDYQFVHNPGYNRDRGPVNLFAVRLHAEF